MWFPFEEEDVTEDDKYVVIEGLVKDGIVTGIDWRELNEHFKLNNLSPIESETLGCYSPITKPFIKTEHNTSSESSVAVPELSEEILGKKDEPIKYPWELYSECEYDQEPNISSEKFDNVHIAYGEASTSKTADDVKPHRIITMQDWLQLPANEYAKRCKNLAISNQLETNLSEDDDSDPQSSYIGNQFSTQQPQSPVINDHVLEPRVYSFQDTLRMDVDKEPQICGLKSGSVPQRGNYRVYCNNRNKRVADLSKLKSIGVKKWGETGNIREDKFPVRKTIIKKKRLHVVEKKTHHRGRRVTRSLYKTIESIVPSDDGETNIGKFVWGHCMGWWPAIIVAAEDGGLESKPEKVCVYWIAEDLISLVNEKSQIEPFSSQLDVRLIKYLEDDEGSKDRKKACFVTLKLFSKYLNIPLLKPYIKWAKKHLVGKTHLNNLKFHPFPKNMQQRLDQLKRKNHKANQKIAHNEARSFSDLTRSPNETSSSTDQEPRDSPDQEPRDNGAQSKFPKEFVRKSIKELLIKSPTEQQHILPLMDQTPGVIVWGKITGHSWWPAMVIHSHDCGKKDPNFGCQWILWYGDYQLSQVQYQNVMKFEEGIKKMRDYIIQCKREKYLKAVLNASKDHCARLSYDTSNWTMDNVLAWVSSLNNNLKTCPIPRPNDGRLESRYSSHIAEKLNEMKSNQEIAAERKNRIKNSDALKAVFAGLPKTLEVLCIICLKICQDGLNHPFFECTICSGCVVSLKPVIHCNVKCIEISLQEDYKATIFAYGDDGKCFYCTLCAGSETIVMCDSFDCPRVYCTACLKYLICPNEYAEILIKDPWLCFLCVEAQDANKNRLFKPRSDWKTRVGQLFHTIEDTSWKNAWHSGNRNTKMRVLSLFDGIGTGLLSLDKLGVEVEEYYASEIDCNAELVTSAYFGDRICRLGDVRNITKDIIDAIAPIDLLIGGSPCTDLSLVNPNRLGLHDPNGTGILFFDYCRIKKLVLEANKGHHLFWLFENVASMPSKYRLAINDALECEPNLIDAADFSPQHRPRLFWGNLPSGANFPPPDPSQDLQSVLTLNCNRHALVKKIRTVTTKVNSLKQGISLLKPVLMNGEADSLWITELEDIFGLPKHYTDVKNLSATKRQKLIGPAWSVQTITALLLPLSYFFLNKSSQARNQQ